jgi:hypothetical protein
MEVLDGCINLFLPSESLDTTQFEPGFDLVADGEQDAILT